MANCLVKLQTFNLWEDLSALRASTDGTPWRNWVPDNFQLYNFNIYFFSTFLLKISKHKSKKKREYFYKKKIFPKIPARVNDHVTFVTPGELPKLHSSRR